MTGAERVAHAVEMADEAKAIAVAGILRLVLGNAGATMVAMGHPGRQFWWSLVTTVASMTGFIIGVQWGIEGVAASIVILGVPLGLLGVVLVGKLIPVTPLGTLIRLFPIALAGVAILGVWWVVALPTDDLPTVLALTLRCGVTAAAYVGLIAMIPAIRHDVTRMLKRLPPTDALLPDEERENT